jgi:PST family polysaccharide transporter
VTEPESTLAASKVAAESAGGQAAPSRTVAQLAATSAMLLLGRRVLIVIVGAASTAVVAREIGRANFGVLASAQGLILLLEGLADFGYSLVLARELASSPGDRRRTMGASVVAATGSGALTVVALIAIVLAAGASSQRGTVLLILMPPLALAGVGMFRQSFLVLYRARRLGVIDVSTNVVQSIATIIVAEAGGGLYGVAIVVSCSAVANALLVGWLGRRLVAASSPTANDIRQFLQSALPLGLASFLASVYFTIDLVLLAWLVSKPQVGEYAVAVKFLGLLVQIPGFVLAGVFPGLASLRTDLAALSELAARVWHWLLAFGLPACVGAAIFAAPLIHLMVGPGYSASITMFRVLSLAAALTLVSNVFGIVLNSLGLARPQLIQNAVAMTFNIVANVLLAPVYGPLASAWLTVVTELIVVCGSLLALRGLLDPRPLLAVSVRPLAACVALAAAGLLLRDTPVIGLPVAAASFLLALAFLRAWPVEMAIPIRRLGARARER